MPPSVAFDTSPAESSFFEVKKLFAREIVTGFARLGGRVIGIVAKQSSQSPGHAVNARNLITPNLAQLTQAPPIRIIQPEQLPPMGLADANAVQAIEADWRRADE